MNAQRWLNVIVVVLLLLTTSGCTSMPDIQGNAYATAIGIDYKDGEWVVYAQIINFNTIAHTDQVEIGKEQPVWIGSGRGETLTSALTEVGATSQLLMFWGHLKAVVMSKEALKKDVKEIYSAINRYREIRYTVYVYGTDKDLREVLKQKSLFNMSPLFTTMFTGTQSSAASAFIRPIMANRAISDLDEPGEHAWIPSIGADAFGWTEDMKERPMFKVTGAYFLRNHQLAGWMSVDELQGARWAFPKLERTPLVIGEKHSATAMLMFSNPKLNIKIVDGDDVRFKLQIKVRGFVMELMKEESIAKMEEMAEHQIAEEVMDTFRKGIKKSMDPYGMLEELYRSNPAKYYEEIAGSRFVLSESSLAEVDVKVKLVNTGKYQGKPP
ncbi:Ger(x)C family spore germination protein [Paenibacillus sp. strain BS8-2]